MDWVKLLTEFDGNPKVLAVGLIGAGLYARALAYCGKYETDGFVPASWVRQAVACEGAEHLPKQLLEVGLWKTTESGPDGYLIPDYLAVNKSREEMENLREIRSANGKRGGQAKGKAKAKAKGKQTNSSSDSCFSSVSVSSEFEEWLEHYRTVTGRDTVRGSKPAREAFAARRKDGWSLEDLKLATVGCHADPWRVEKGHDVPDTILRPSKVEGYIQFARQPKFAGAPVTQLPTGTRDRSRYDAKVEAAS